MSNEYREHLLSIKSIEGSLWENRFVPEETLTVIRHYPHTYLPNKAKLDVYISTSKEGYEDNFSQEHLLKMYTRVM